MVQSLPVSGGLELPVATADGLRDDRAHVQWAASP